MSWDAIVEVVMEAVKCKETTESVPDYINQDDGMILDL